jgi:arylsulfatase A-like enzyme
MIERTRKIRIVLMAAVLAFAGQLAAAETAAKPPNVILIFTDDQGYQDLGCFGAPKIKTPHIDRMANEGMRFTDFYVANSVCSPSRASLLTGCYPDRVGIANVLFPHHKEGLNPEETSIADILKAKGYATTCVGKWHIGHKPEFLPTRHGFDSYYGIPYSNDMSLDRTAKFADDVIFREGQGRERLKTKKDWVPLMRNDEVIEYPVDQTTLTQRYTKEAISFIKANKDKPFFIYLAHTMPHIPLFASPAFKGKSAGGPYGDTIEEIDWSVGEVLKTLKAEGVDQNTIVIFTSDNGPWSLSGGRGGSAYPLRGHKFGTLEGGQRVPCVMRWPARIPAGKTCREIASTIDILPTIAHITGSPLPEKKIDGKNILALMTAEPGAKSPHDYFYYYRGGKLEAARSGKWKLRITKEKPFLYNLEEDIGERKNEAGAFPEIVERLQKAMSDFDAELKSQARQPGRIGPQPAPNKKGTPQKIAEKLDWSKVKVGGVYASVSAPAVVKKAFTISGEMEVAADAKHVVLAHGGTAVGYVLYLNGGELVFAVATGKKHLERVKTAVQAGKFSFEAGLDDKGHLFVQVGDNEAVSSQTGGHWISKWPAEDLSVGFDHGNPVDPKAPKEKFKGKQLKLNVK